MEREAFLERVRTSLGSGSRDNGAVTGVPDFYRRAPLDGGISDPVDRFVAEFEGVGGRVIAASTVAEASGELRKLLAGSTSLMAWDRSEFAGWGVDWLWDEIGAKPGGTDLACEFGITTVDSAVANMGSLVVTASTTRPRSVSLVVSTHIALVRADQIVDRTGIAMEKIQAAGETPSAIYFITGPSRSADIENDLTIGVHGPAALIVILLTPQTSIR